MESNAIIQKLTQLEKLIIGRTKQIFTDDVVNYTGFLKSYVYKLVHNNILPYSKPNNRTLFLLKPTTNGCYKTNQKISFTDQTRCS
jgi:hypothetical protein